MALKVTVAVATADLANPFLRLFLVRFCNEIQKNYVIPKFFLEFLSISVPKAILTME